MWTCDLRLKPSYFTVGGRYEDATLATHLANINMDLQVSLQQGPQLIKIVISKQCKNRSGEDEAVN